MIDIYKFEKSQKMSWLKRIASQNDRAWYKLLTESVKNICNVTSLGGEWCSSILKKVNPFWTNVLRNWMLICESNTVTCNQDILHSALWFNKHISVNKIYFPDWSAKSISTVADIVDSTGKVMDLHLLKKKYNIRINILNYYTIKKSVNKFVESHKKGENFEIIRPFIPFHSETLYNSGKGSKTFYTKLIDVKKAQQNHHEIKWNSNLSGTNHWEDIYKACFRSVPDNNYIWLQYRILYRILGTNEYLYKLKLSGSNLCRLSSLKPESIEHLFAHCKETTLLWNNMKNWFFSKISYNIEWTVRIKILCYTKQDEHFWPINFILII